MLALAREKLLDAKKAVASIATFVPKDRALSPAEIRLAFHQLESIVTYPTIRLALRMVLPENWATAWPWCRLTPRTKNQTSTTAP